MNNSGHIERARELAGHVSIRTTRLYDHTNKAVTMDDVVLIDLRRRTGKAADQGDGSVGTTAAVRKELVGDGSL